MMTKTTLTGTHRCDIDLALSFFSFFDPFHIHNVCLSCVRGPTVSTAACARYILKAASPPTPK